MKLEFRSLLVLLAVSATLVTQGAESRESKAGETSGSDLLTDLISTNQDVRLEAASKLDDKRQQIVAHLIEILKSTNSAKTKIPAVIVLGEYRASEAVPILVQNLEWDDAARGGFYNGQLRREEFEAKVAPVTFALQKIGGAAIGALLNRIKESDDDTIAEKCVSICANIEGQEVTQFRLERLLGGENGRSKERIQTALRLLRESKPIK